MKNARTKKTLKTIWNFTKQVNCLKSNIDSDFGFELSSKHKNNITQLLAFKIQNPEEELSSECSAAMVSILAATKRDKFTPSFNQRVAVLSDKGVNVEIVTDPRHRLSMSC